jgi:hypothetical protein
MKIGGSLRYTFAGTHLLSFSLSCLVVLSSCVAMCLVLSCLVLSCLVLSCLSCLAFSCLLFGLGLGLCPCQEGGSLVSNFLLLSILFFSSLLFSSFPLLFSSSILLFLSPSSNDYPNTVLVLSATHKQQ